MFLIFSKRFIFISLLACMLGSAWLLTTLPEAHAQRVESGKKYGELGRVTAEKAMIYATPAPTGRILIKVPRDTYLALTKRKGSYYGVRMADDSVGYIATRDMEVVDYIVVSSGPEPEKEGNNRSKSSPAPKMRSGDLASVQERVIEALRASDWNALLREARSELAISEYRRVYESDREVLRQKRLVPEDALGKAVDSSGEEGGSYVVTTLLLNTRKPLSLIQNAAFLSYCRQVQDTYRTDPRWVQRGAYLKAEDGFPLVGPAVQGKNNSASHWRVEFAFDGRWYVNRLISTLH